MNISGISLFPLLYNTRLSKIPAKITHETIHITTKLLIIFFFIWYALEYIFRTFQHGGFMKGYRNISFEEAYLNEKDPEYLSNRKLYSFF
jgi:predicted membrane protein